MRLKPYLEYKDSGVEWLGEVPEGWIVKRLKYLSTCNDESLPESTDPLFEILYVDIGSVSRTEGIVKKEELNFENAPSRARRIVKDGDTIISTVRTYLRAIASIKMPEDNLIVSTGFAVIRPANISSDYLSLFLTSHYNVESVVSRSVGVSYPAINAGEIGNFFSPVPPHQEQQAIAAFLDSETARIDTLIQKKEQMIELLKEKRIALITQAVTKGLDPNVKMKDSGIEWLGEVPENWAVKRLRFLVKVPLQYGAIEAAELDDPDLPRYIRITDIDEKGNLREDGIKTIPLEKAKPYMLNDGDLLLARSGATAGKTLLYKETWGAAAFAGYLIRATFNELVLPDFASYYTSSQIYTSWLNMVLIQATIQNISAEKYKELSIPVPSICEQRRIVDYLRDETNKFDMIMNTATHSISLLHEYRSSLIHSAVTGKIDLRGYNE